MEAGNDDNTRFFNKEEEAVRKAVYSGPSVALAHGGEKQWRFRYRLYGAFYRVSETKAKLWIDVCIPPHRILQLGYSFR